MVTGAERISHYAEAERLLQEAEDVTTRIGASAEARIAARSHLTAAAQVHATLAVADSIHQEAYLAAERARLGQS